MLHSDVAGQIERTPATASRLRIQGLETVTRRRDRAGSIGGSLGSVRKTAHPLAIPLRSDCGDPLGGGITLLGGETWLALADLAT